MAGVPALLKIIIDADATKAVSGMKDASDSASGLGSTFKTIGKVIAPALGIGAITAFGAASVSAAQESQVANARLEQVMSQMGDTTGTAVEAAKDYASALSAKIGVEDESILAGQAQLATFGEVNNETARMAGIFDRATAAGADLAAAGFGSIESNAVQLGKALQDPTKGMTALAKSGVTFTDAQKEQIKVLQESGNLLEAQKIVLGAVEQQVGGTAAATATSTGKMSVAFGEVQESVGSFLLPVISSLATVLTRTVIPAVQDFLGVLRDKAEPIIQSVQAAVQAFVKEGFPKLVDIIKQVIPYIQTFATALITTVGPALSKIIEAVKQAAPPIMALAKDVFMFMAKNVLPLVADAMDKIVPIVTTLATTLAGLAGWLAQNRDILAAILIPIGAFIVVSKLMALYTWATTAATQAWAAAQVILNAVMSANPIMIVVLAIAAIIAILIVAYNRVDWFRAFVDAAFDAIVKAFNFLKDAAVAVFNWVSDHWPLLLAILTGPVGIAVLLITKNFDTLKDAAMSVVNWVQDRFQDLTGFLSRIASSISGILSSIADAIRYPIDAATQAVKWVMDKFNELAGFFSGLIHTIGGYVSSIANAIKGPINAVIRAWNGLQFTVPAIDVGPVHFGGQTIGMPDIPTLASGGRVMRTGMALVHEGEQFSGVGKSYGKGQTVNITVNTTGLGADAPQIQRAVVHALRGYTARNGPLNVPVAGIG